MLMSVFTTSLPPSVSRHVAREIVWKMDTSSRASACGGGGGCCNSLRLVCSSTSGWIVYIVRWAQMISSDIEVSWFESID